MRDAYDRSSASPEEKTGLVAFLYLPCKSGNHALSRVFLWFGGIPTVGGSSALRRIVRGCSCRQDLPEKGLRLIFRHLVYVQCGTFLGLFVLKKVFTNTPAAILRLGQPRPLPCNHITTTDSLVGIRFKRLVPGLPAQFLCNHNRGNCLFSATLCVHRYELPFLYVNWLIRNFWVFAYLPGQPATLLLSQH